MKKKRYIFNNKAENKYSFITKVDAATGETLMWCGGSDFNIIQAQKKLNNGGMSLQEIRKDKWALVGPVASPQKENTNNG